MFSASFQQPTISYSAGVDSRGLPVLSISSSFWILRGYRNPAGILTTAGGLLFTSNSGYLVALDATDGKTVWKTNVGGRRRMRRSLMR
jgi:outer membrane protein assembly factor BamB